MLDAAFNAHAHEVIIIVCIGSAPIEQTDRQTMYSIRSSTLAMA